MFKGTLAFSANEDESKKPRNLKFKYQKHDIVDQEITKCGPELIPC